MRINKLKYLFPVAVLMLASCESLLDEKPTNEWSDSYAWSVASFAEGVLYNAYSAMPSRPDSYDNNFLDAATDNALTNVYGSNVYKLSMGGMTISDNPIGNWSVCYTQLQYINSFLENGLTEATIYKKEDPTMNEMYKQRLKGEAYFLRAYWGFKLLQMYGGKTDDGQALGYPMFMHFIKEEQVADYENITRSTYEECAEQIMSDCDVAYECLPASYTGDDEIYGKKQLGRATQSAALALKSTVALYAASPAYQDNNVIVLQEMGKFNVVDSEAYKQKWERAAIAADEALKLSEFSTFYPLKAANLADTPVDAPKEFLLFSFFKSFGFEQRHFAPYYWGMANNIPSQNLVDAFPMQNGYPIDRRESGYDKNNPYAGRDKRFYLNIYAHGLKYGNNGLPVDILEGGKDSKTFSQYASRSGYYLAKFMSKDEDMLNPVAKVNVKHYYPIMRRTEVWLNYAEAANEAWGPKGKGEGCTYTAYDVIKMIREQSGGITNDAYLDEVVNNQGKEGFRTLIQNERRIELAFENQRYFDMRRWLLPLNESVKGVSVVNEANGLVYNYSELEERRYNDIRYYYSPIPYEECLKNPNLKNNLGWK